MELIRDEEFKSIYYLDCFQKEFRSLFNNEKEYKRHKEALVFRLKIMDNIPSIQALLLDSTHFEKLKGVPGLYAIRHQSRNLNPRTIFIYEESEGVYILLLSFLEKRKSDYTQAIRRAQGMLRELEGDDEE